MVFSQLKIFLTVKLKLRFWNGKQNICLGMRTQNDWTMVVCELLPSEHNHK